MFEFTTNKGIAIDGKYFNVFCFEKIKLNRSNCVGFVRGISYLPTIAFDIPFENQQNTPLVGVSLYEGIAYAEASYISLDGQKRVRIWLLFDEFLIQQNFPSFNYTSKFGGVYNANNESEFINYVTNSFDLNLYIYNTQPNHNSNFGLQVFDDNGNTIFSSDYRPMKMGVKGSVNDGNHIIFLDHFFDFSWTENEVDGPNIISMIGKQCSPIMSIYTNGKVVDYQYHFTAFDEKIQSDISKDSVRKEWINRFTRSLRFNYPSRNNWYRRLIEGIEIRTMVGYY